MSLSAVFKLVFTAVVFTVGCLVELYFLRYVL